MIRDLFEQFEIIEETNAAEFKEELNRLMRAHAHQQPKCKTEISGPTWRAVITYAEEVLTPEGIRDEFKMKGKEYTCGECPYFELPTHHKNCVWAFCDQDGRMKKRRKESPACDWLLEKIKTEEVII